MDDRIDLPQFIPAAGNLWVQLDDDDGSWEPVIGWVKDAPPDLADGDVTYLPVTRWGVGSNDREVYEHPQRG